MSAKPKPAFFFVVLAVIVALLAYAFRDKIFPEGDSNKPTANIDPTELAAGSGVEAADASVPTTVKEYSFVPSEKLPPVKEASDYAPLEARTVKFALNVWAGWAPIILQNGGAAPGKIWTTPDGEDFKVELVLIDDPVAMRDAYAAGKVHIGWATLDMLPLFHGRAEERQPHHAPRLPAGRLVERRRRHRHPPQRRGQIPPNRPWPTCAGKKIVLAQNSPSEYFVLNALVNGGVQPSEVEFKPVGDAFQAAAAFNADKSIAACVSWAPDIYNLSDVDGNHLLVSTATANKLIADVWFARADFARDHMDICEGLVRGIFDGMETMKDDRRPHRGRQPHVQDVWHPRRRDASPCSATPTRPTTPKTATSS